ncbi:GTP-binding protein Rheb isoform X1 [Heterocephalus glaber]|uniref:GTP-binding protein Rheb n=1 Tax=Heterocephalus glaber TaxID=10181 RepID=A0AAX6RI41_HETGA|nr:GTP-binding protein Rheb isoform X1 [Heterocephalus glaber]
MPQSKSRKIAILGYRSVGKSSLTIQFVEGQFVDSYDPTIENTFTKLITVNGQEYHLQLVDTAGQDEYSIFPQTYSIDINGYILVYSVTSIKSFEVIKVIHGKLLDMVGKVQIPIMLVGNKKDLHMERVISYEEGKALAESWNAAFLESSAKENQWLHLGDTDWPPLALPEGGPLPPSHDGPHPRAQPVLASLLSDCGRRFQKDNFGGRKDGRGSFPRQVFVLRDVMRLRGLRALGSCPA